MTSQEFEKKWLKTFVPDLTKDQYDKCYIEQYLWHVFSFELIPKEKVLSGNEAREAYEKADKENAIIINFWDCDEKTQSSVIDEKSKKWEVLDEKPETYVVDSEWKWTYVSTHENDWLGPYFYKIGD